MVYRRNNRRRFRKTPGRGVKKLATKVARLARELKPELKQFDGTIGATSITTSGTLYQFMQPSQGVAYTQRIGVKIKPVSLAIRMQLKQATAATALNTFVRVIFFRGVREEGLTYNTGDILMVPTVQSALVYLDRDRFSVLSDRTYALSAANQTCLMIQHNFRTSKHMRFTGNGTTVQDGGFYMLVIGNEPSGSEPEFQAYIRNAFTDV